MQWRIWILAVFACLVASTTPAADLPKKGTLTGTFGWYPVGKMYPLSPEMMVWVGEFSGVFHNSHRGGPFDSSGVVCPAINEIEKGVSSSHGRCTLTDKDGDIALIVWKCGGAFPQCDGQWQWAGGTGKYTGIKGNNAFACRFLTPTASHGECDWKAEWQLP